jgi:hypothetical protein
MARKWMFIVGCLAFVGCVLPAASIAAPVTCNDPVKTCDVAIVNPTCATGTCTASVNVDPVHFERGKNNIKAVWTLPNGFGFCPQASDGVFLKKDDSNDQFDQQGAEGPSGSGRCNKKKFHMRAKNTKSQSTHPYKIVFHNDAGTQEYLVDPTMVND